MIKKYAPFLLESIEHEFLSFSVCLRDCVEYYQEEWNGPGPFDGSYSHAAKLHRDHLMDPKRDFELIDTYMTGVGWPLEKVRKLAQNENFYKRIYSDTGLSTTAPTDYYLYQVTNKKFPLQGYKWPDAAYFRDNRWSNGEDDELLIRYGYGWHKSKYGKLIIKQNMGSVLNFLKEAFNDIPGAVIYQLSDHIGLNHNIMRHSNQQDSSSIDRFEYSDELRSCFFPEKFDMYIDNVELLKIFEKTGKLEKKDISYTQQEFDNLVIDTCKNLKLEGRIVTEGDIKIKFN